jgi:hypothetical protein
MLKAGRKTLVKDGRRLQGMAFLVSLDNETETFDSEFERMVHGIYDWYDKYQNRCGELCLGFVAPEPEHHQIVTYCLALIENAESLLPLFRQLGEVNLFFVPPEGGEPKEIILQLEDAAKDEEYLAA